MGDAVQGELGEVQERAQAPRQVGWFCVHSVVFLFRINLIKYYLLTVKLELSKTLSAMGRPRLYKIRRTVTLSMSDGERTRLLNMARKHKMGVSELVRTEMNLKRVNGVAR